MSRYSIKTILALRADVLMLGIANVPEIKCLRRLNDAIGLIQRYPLK